MLASLLCAVMAVDGDPPMEEFRPVLPCDRESTQHNPFHASQQSKTYEGNRPIRSPIRIELMMVRAEHNDEI
jgi:hypothetical protein